eukprot:jgi/Botrbrau1/21614/Bobra.43_1s0018.1
MIATTSAICTFQQQQLKHERRRRLVNGRSHDFGISRPIQDHTVTHQCGEEAMEDVKAACMKMCSISRWTELAIKGFAQQWVRV